MRPVLFDLGGLQVQSYGVSKALAALVAGWLLGREMRRRGYDPEPAMVLAIAATIGGFVGAKLYYLAEVSGRGITAHDLGGSGFTWYGGLIAGAATTILVARRRGIPIGPLSGMAAIPLAVAYGIGRLGCLLAGDGTYGRPTSLPWGMRFPHGTVPTTQFVHPTPLYEALTAFAVALVLLRLRDRLAPTALFGVFAVLMGLARFLVEFVRLNDRVVLGLTTAQLFSLAMVAGGALLIRQARPRAQTESAQRAVDVAA